jgi:RNA polymerase II-associated factor 1
MLTYTCSQYKLQRAGVQPRDLNTPEGQIRAVEDTFEAAKRIPVHPTNPSLQVVEILSVFPDFDLWPNAYTEVVFDSDPITTLPQERIEAMDDEDKHYLRSNAIVRSIKGQQLVAFITPTATHKRTREEITEEDEEYEQVNAFHFDVAKDADLKDNYFFVFKKDGVYYNELATRVKLRKVQSKEEKLRLLSIPKPSSVHVACEEMADETKVERDERFTELLHPASAEEAADM